MENLIHLTECEVLVQEIDSKYGEFKIMLDFQYNSNCGYPHWLLIESKEQLDSLIEILQERYHQMVAGE